METITCNTFRKSLQTTTEGAKSTFNGIFSFIASQKRTNLFHLSTHPSIFWTKCPPPRLAGCIKPFQTPWRQCPAQCPIHAMGIHQGRRYSNPGLLDITMATLLGVITLKDGAWDGPVCSEQLSRLLIPKIDMEIRVFYKLYMRHRAQ